MKASIFVKSIFASFLYRTGVVSWKLRRKAVHNFVILTYHRVIPEDQGQRGVQAGMYVTPGTFEMHVRFLKNHFTVVPLSEIAARTKSGLTVLRLNNKPQCVLTFDDGWYDFYTYAFPILKAYRIPATMFLPTDFIGTENWFWTDRLTFLLYRRHKSEDSENLYDMSKNTLVNRLSGLTGRIESRVEASIELLKSFPLEKIEEAIRELSLFWKISANPKGRAFMTWDEVKEMAQSGVIDFGSHTASHRILTTLPRDQIREELKRSREVLIKEDVASPDFVSFSYPNGNYDKNIVEMAKNCNYDAAVTTKQGWNSLDPDLFQLKRVNLHQDMTFTKSLLACRVAGLV